MCDLNEVIFSSDATGHLWNICVWNPKTGTSLMHYKAGTSSAVPKTVCLLGTDYILSADSNKPLIHIWPLNSQEQVSNLRLVTPGKVNALAVSPDNNFLVAGIDEKLYIWQITSGKLLNILNRHYQKINCLKFIDTSTHFISGGADGILIVWSLSSIIATQNNSIFSQKQETKTDQFHIFNDHSLAITDVYVGKGGINCRFVSVSLDRTCKIYDFLSKELLLSIVFNEKLTAVTLNWLETSVFVGCNNGDIFEFSLKNPPRIREHHLTVENKQQIFREHKKEIISLSVSCDNETLLSASEDERILLWNIPSRNHIRTITHKGPVTNAFFATAHSNIFAERIQSKIILHLLERNIQNVDEANDVKIEILNVDNNYLTEVENYSNNNVNVTDILTKNATKQEQMRKEIESLKRINNELYQTAVNNIVQKYVIQGKAKPLPSDHLTKKRKLHKTKIKLAQKQ